MGKKKKLKNSPDYAAPLMEPMRPRRRFYDWVPIANYCREHPGVWFRLSDPERSKTTAHGIRRGMPAAFDPPGAFDALVRADGTYLIYVGDPVEPWKYYLTDSPAFEDLPRDPDYTEELSEIPRLDRAPRKAAPTSRDEGPCDGCGRGLDRCECDEEEGD